MFPFYHPQTIRNKGRNIFLPGQFFWLEFCTKKLKSTQSDIVPGMSLIQDKHRHLVSRSQFFWPVLGWIQSDARSHLIKILMQQKTDKIWSPLEILIAYAGCVSDPDSYDTYCFFWISPLLIHWQLPNSNYIFSTPQTGEWKESYFFFLFKGIFLIQFRECGPEQKKKRTHIHQSWDLIPLLLQWITNLFLSWQGRLESATCQTEFLVLVEKAVHLYMAHQRVAAKTHWQKSC